MAAIAIQSVIIFVLLYLFLSLLINIPAGCAAENILGTNEVLNSGDYLQYGNDILVMQGDCNLVLYRSNSPIWASNTGGLGTNCYCRMQYDGNLVIYEPSSQRAIWATNTARDNGYYVLILQRDGNLVIYGGAIWAAGTNLVKTSLPIIGSDKPKGPELVVEQAETQFSHRKAPRKSKLQVAKDQEGESSSGRNQLSAGPVSLNGSNIK